MGLHYLRPFRPWFDLYKTNSNFFPRSSPSSPPFYSPLPPFFPPGPPLPPAPPFLPCLAPFAVSPGPPCLFRPPCCPFFPLPLFLPCLPGLPSAFCSSRRPPGPVFSPAAASRRACVSFLPPFPSLLPSFFRFPSPRPSSPPPGE